MKKQWKGFISGIMVSLLLFGLIGTASATIGKRTLEVDYTDIKIELNGEQINPTDVNGNIVEPFAYNGTTYLPIRAVASALGLDVDWDGTTKTVRLECPAADECYPNFSVPSLENIIGHDAFVDIYFLESGDSIAYYYNPQKITATNYLTEYGNLLQKYGFSRAQSLGESDTCYRNATSGTTVIIDTNASGLVLVLVMNVSNAESSNGLGSTSSTGNTPVQPIGFSFPLHLYSNDGKVYLGKLVTNTYDTDSIWNTYGTYGSQYSTKSIWNEYGTYGSKYSLESAFNEYATKPPKIVDNNGKFFGYLTANEYTQNGYTITELQRYLLQNNQ